MVERRELITICRQIGTMMEVGVDFLRITGALRAQTDNPRLLELYDQVEHDMKMGEGLADALSNAPDVFSPFAVSLIRQGEARGDIEGAWYKIADFLKQQEQEDLEFGHDAPSFGAGYIPTRGLPSNGLEIVAPRAPVTVGMLNDLIDRLQSAFLRALTWVAGLLLTLAAVWAMGELGWIISNWLPIILCSVAALFIGGAGSWVRHRLDVDRRRQPSCSFCGKAGGEASLQRSPRLAGAAICTSCAEAIAGKDMENRLPDDPFAIKEHDAHSNGNLAKPAKTNEPSAS